MACLLKPAGGKFLSRLGEILNRTFPGHSDWNFRTPLSRRTYAIGVVVIFACVYLQYFIKDLGHIVSAVVIYGIPVAAASYLFGTPILSRAFRNNL
ncbi:MAG TPA: hypothetical protein VLS90_21015, partial [Thermodesulfobacteriota bacterium]|nr:hypothetical protein [Thermodesulfobacteriota bacterium]